jgi:D-serine deaminase-like pyridoxal phosphate-dependent protein
MPGVTYTKASDEHGWLEGKALPALGEKVLLVPGHCDPTINLYDWYVVVCNEIVVDLWAITARGAVT